jgi:protein TonB
MDIAIDGKAFGIAVLGIIAAVVILITLMRYFLSQKTKKSIGSFHEKTKHSPLHERNKYLLVDVFKFSGTFFNIGLAIALGVTVLAFGWTKFEVSEKFSISMAPVDIEDFQITRTPPEPPKKLPPPPDVPKFEIVSNEIPTDTLDFIGIDLDKDIERPAPVGKPKKKAVFIPIPKDAPEPDDIPFRVVEEMPRFPGCEDLVGTKEEKKSCADIKLLQFIQRNIKYPAIARENGIQGRCYITFVVEKDGSISNIALLRDIGGKCGEESLRVINLMANNVKWAPGKQRGQTVRVQFSLPVHFRLE